MHMTLGKFWSRMVFLISALLTFLLHTSLWWGRPMHYKMLRSICPLGASSTSPVVTAENFPDFARCSLEATWLLVANPRSRAENWKHLGGVPIKAHPYSVHNFKQIASPSKSHFCKCRMKFTTVQPQIMDFCKTEIRQSIYESKFSPWCIKRSNSIL